MGTKIKTEEIISILMESALYFELSLTERLELIKELENQSDEA